MAGQQLRWRGQDGALVIAGLTGLAMTLALACDEDVNMIDTAPDSGVPSPDGAPSGDVTASCTNSPTTAEHTAAVVAAADTLLGALTDEQRTAIQYQKTLANAQQWSNYPTSAVQRNGVRIGDMSSEAQAAALALAHLAAGTTGATLLAELREADEFLVTDAMQAPTTFGRGLYYFSLHGTPSTHAPWMLQIAGHHLAYNFTYAGSCTSATPLFDGVEPTTWTDVDGAFHAPLEAQRAAMTALVASIASLPGAELSGTFSDLINGPASFGPPSGGAPSGADAGAPPGGGFEPPDAGFAPLSGGAPGTAGGRGDTKYPSGLTYPTGTTQRGVLVSALSAEQQALAKTAIEAWVKNVADPVSNALLADYESEEALAQTYVGYAGSVDLATESSYVRVDGPRVWIEFSVQPGPTYQGEVHYHTIWRDKAADYGAEYRSE